MRNWVLIGNRVNWVGGDVVFWIGKGGEEENVFSGGEVG